jgi:hypothetical protein
MAIMQRPGMNSPAENDIFTILLMIGAVFIIIATVVLAYQFVTYFGLDSLWQGTALLEK